MHTRMYVCVCMCACVNVLCIMLEGGGFWGLVTDPFTAINHHNQREEERAPNGELYACTQVCMCVYVCQNWRAT